MDPFLLEEEREADERTASNGEGLRAAVTPSPLPIRLDWPRENTPDRALPPPAPAPTLPPVLADDESKPRCQLPEGTLLLLLLLPTPPPATAAGEEAADVELVLSVAAFVFMSLLLSTLVLSLLALPQDRHPDKPPPPGPLDGDDDDDDNGVDDDAGTDRCDL